MSGNLSDAQMCACLHQAVGVEDAFTFSAATVVEIASRRIRAALGAPGTERTVRFRPIDAQPR